MIFSKKFDSFGDIYINLNWKSVDECKRILVESQFLSDSKYTCQINAETFILLKL